MSVSKSFWGVQLKQQIEATGYWAYKELETPLCYFPNKAIVSSTIEYDQEAQDVSGNPFESLKKSIVSVDCYPPFVVDGSKNPHSYGAGIIVSMNPPLVVCDRDTVPISISVISLTFENSLTISAELVFLHPFYNFAVLKFDPTPVLEAGIKMKAAALDDKDFEIGDQVTYIGLSGKKKSYMFSQHISCILITALPPPPFFLYQVKAKLI